MSGAVTPDVWNISGGARVAAIGFRVARDGDQVRFVVYFSP